MAQFPSKPVESPCNQICQLNEQNICIGCYRTIDEITLWPDATVEQKLDILANVAVRIQAADE